MATIQKEYLLVLRDQETFKRAQEAEITKKMLRALIEAKESEHKRLAQELHDGIGQSLFTVSVALQAVETFVKDNPKLNDYIHEVQQELQKAMDDIKSYSQQLRPHSLDQLGLVPTVQMMIDTMMKNFPELSIELTTNAAARCEPVVEINLYREFKRAIDRGCDPNDDDVQARIFRKVRCKLSDITSYDQRMLKKEIERYCRRRW